MSKKKKEIIELSPESIGMEGVAVARNEGRVYFVKGAVPGDKVLASVRKKRKSYSQAQCEEVLEPSEHRISPKCEYFGSCGGCSWQHLEYGQQIYWKKQNLIDCFERIGGIKSDVIDTMPAPEVYYYRNKMEFSFGASRWLLQEEIEKKDEIEQKSFALGLHVPGRYDKVIDIERCHIQKDKANEMLNLIREKSFEKNIKPYNLHNHEGFLRNLIIRHSAAENSFMLILVTTDISNDDEQNFVDWFGRELPLRFSEISNTIHSVNNGKNPVAVDRLDILFGPGYLTEKIFNIDFRISPYSFFQTNTFQLNSFIGLILDYAEIKQNDTVWDLYCGTGSITLPAAQRCKEIYGLELVQSSIDDAKLNAEINGIKNATFCRADLHDREIPGLLGSLPDPDLIIIDPPRAGMHKNLVNHVLEANPERITYVSCNPATQARDCALLSEKYEVIKIRPVDMFPHTFHVESVAKWKSK